MKVYEEKEVIKKEKVLKGLKCDTCKKDINETDIDFYYSVTTSHDRWGNDSIESYKELEFCSWECLLNDMGRYFAFADDTYRYEIERESK